MPTLSQRLGSFPTKSRAEILPWCRRYYPLTSPINRGSIDDLREEKLWSKVSQKTSFSGINTVLSLSSLSLPFQPPTGATTSSTTGSQHNCQPTTMSHCRFLSPLCSPSHFLLLLLLPLPLAANSSIVPRDAAARTISSTS